MFSDFDNVHKAKDSADPLLLFHFLAKCRLFLICPVVNMKLLFLITEESQGFFPTKVPVKTEWSFLS